MVITNRMEVDFVKMLRDNDHDLIDLATKILATFASHDYDEKQERISEHFVDVDNTPYCVKITCETMDGKYKDYC